MAARISVLATKRILYGYMILSCSVNLFCLRRLKTEFPYQTQLLQLQQQRLPVEDIKEAGMGSHDDAPAETNAAASNEDSSTSRTTAASNEDSSTNSTTTWARPVLHESTVPANWLDDVVAAQFGTEISNSTLKVVYPLRWKLPLFRGVTSTKKEIVHAYWNKQQQHDGFLARRLTGVGPKAVSTDEGGETVIGDWPDQLDQLTFISILKNAHTRLMNVVGDLRQRLNGTADYISARGGKEVLLDIQASQLGETDGNRHAVFAVVRDPIDRFISGTCQDNLERLRPCLMKMKTSEAQVDCFINEIKVKGRFMFHQKPQAAQLIYSLQNVDLGVTLIPMEMASSHLIAELGGKNKKKRDRQDIQYHKEYKKGDEASKWCQLTPLDLSSQQIESLCEIYACDVKMMEYAGIDVPLCAKKSSSNATEISWKDSSIIYCSEKCFAEPRQDGRLLDWMLIESCSWPHAELMSAVSFPITKATSVKWCPSVEGVLLSFSWRYSSTYRFETGHWNLVIQWGAIFEEWW